MLLTFMDCIAVALAAVLCLLVLRQNRRRTIYPLPPGPPRWPIVGSMFSMPKANETLDVFTEWGKRYDDITYARVLGQNIVVLNSSEAAIELLERRSVVYSQRPRMVMANELVGWGDSLATMSYSDSFKRMRKLLFEGMSPKAMETLRPLQEQEAVKFIQRLLDTPDDFSQHIRQTAGATVLKLAYGYNVEDRHDHLLNLAERAVDMFSVATTPGLFLVDVFPWLRHVPWAPFKTKAKAWRKLMEEFSDQPMEYTRQQMKKGQSEACLVARWLERAEDSGSEQDETLIKWAGGAIYGGGADTTVSAISTFFVAMLHYPEAQAAAQAEIDQIVGMERLPTYSDRDSLPYVEALYKEVLRWIPVAPFGIPHRLEWEKDDVYRGMFIPRGTVVIPNIWAMVRDPNIYHAPETFKPARFLDSHNDVRSSAEPDPDNFVFGFGRRRCPGIHVAQSSVWLSIVLTLAAYNITPTTGPDGKPKLPSLNYSQITISHPEPFQCSIKPRSSKVKELVQDLVISA